MKKQRDIVTDLIRLEFRIWEREAVLKKSGVKVEFIANFSLMDIAFDAMGFPENGTAYDRFKIYNFCINHYHGAKALDVDDLVDRLYRELDSLMLQRPEFFTVE